MSFTKNSYIGNSILKLNKFLKKFIKFLILLLLAAYRTVGTNLLGGSCRFNPSCSEYAVECLERFSTIEAIILIVKRLSKCHPLGGFGFDPAPEVKGK